MRLSGKHLQVEKVSLSAVLKQYFGEKRKFLAQALAQPLGVQKFPFINGGCDLVLKHDDK